VSFITASGLLFCAGCRDHAPHAFTWPAGGKQFATHPKPPEGGYYANWDPYAAAIEVTPAEEVNAVGTQHVFIATVKDKDGEPLPNRRVEWMLSDGVGSIVEVDESGVRASRGYKVDNRFAVSHTNNFDHVLTRGNDDPSDDIHLTRGQTWCVITSPVEGTSHVVAYAPGIYDWDKHKVFLKKHWYDIAWEIPPEASNPIGTAHKFTTKVTTHSDGKPLEGYAVTYKILSGPAAVLQPGDGATATVKTDAQGLATVTLKQVKPVEGVNELQVDILRPADEKCCKPAVHVATGNTRKAWIGPKIAISKTATPKALIRQQIEYRIVLTNPSQVATSNTVLTDTVPDGVVYVSSQPEAKVAGQMLTWNLGSIPAGGESAVSVIAKTTKVGEFCNTSKVTADHGLAAEARACTMVTAPALKMTKTAPAEVLICEPITYEVVVTNTGDAPATNVMLEDNLPNGLLYQEKHSTVTADFGTLAPGESKQVEYAVNASKPGTYTNSAEVTGDYDLSATAKVKTVVRQPVLAIVKDAPRALFAGRRITYTITVTNKGDGVARNCVVMDSVPAGCTFVSASGGVKPVAGTLSWKLGDLAPEASKKVTFAVRADAIGDVENLTSVSAMCAKGSAKAMTAVRGIPAILLECVDEADPIEVGSRETYTITVTNQGTAADTNIVIKCTLPAEQEYVSATGPTKETVKARTVTFAPLKSLAPKARATYKVVAKGVKAGDVRFAVSLTSDQLKTPVEETESTNIYSDQ
jgi:uncharacterized repeat protein (TIGR01451 family)